MRRLALVLTALSLAVAAVGCDRAAPATPTLDVQATVDAAISATSAAEESAQATIDAAVQATVAADRATREVALTPTPAPQYVEMSEEELAGAVVEATTETEEAAGAAAAAAADEAVTQEEIGSVQVYLMDAEEAIAYAEELISAYYALYGDLAMETLVLLEAIEGDLAVLAEEAIAMEQALLEIEAALQQGLGMTEETLAQLGAAAQMASTKAAEIQAENQAWVQDLRSELESRVADALAVQASASEVAADRRGALASAAQYVQAVREGLADSKISRSELANIAQLGANASASLDAQGGPQLQRLSESIDTITGQIAGGQVPQARADLGGLESALGSIPGRP
jgi:hypothetical protein